MSDYFDRVERQIVRRVEEGMRPTRRPSAGGYLAVVAEVLVVFVVVLFLQTWRASIIPLAAVPVSIVGTFAVMLAASLAVIAPVTEPTPVIVPVLSEMPALSVSVEEAPSTVARLSVIARTMTISPAAGELLAMVRASLVAATLLPGSSCSATGCQATRRAPNSSSSENS